MGKPSSRRLLPHIIIFIITITLVLVQPVNVASANSAPPPSVAWFTFVDQTGQSPRLEGVQLIACDSTNCQQPVLLQQFGACGGVECMKSIPTLSGWSTAFECAVGICRSSAYPNHGGTGFRLVAQFSDRVRVSDVMGALPSRYGESAAWRVAIRETDLALSQDQTIPTFKNPGQLMVQNLAWIGFSIVVELGVAAVCFQIWSKTDTAQILRRLLVVLLVNLVSLAVVWMFFPSLGHFQLAGSRSFGLFVLFLSGLFCVLLISIYRSTGKARPWAISLTVVAIVLAILVCGFIGIIIGYHGSYATYVQGLSSSIIIILSEIFAVVFEALMIAILTKTPISTGFVWLTSLLMNSASFLLGLFLISR